MRHIHTPAVSKKLTCVQLSPASRLMQAAEPDFPPWLCLPRRGIPGVLGRSKEARINTRKRKDKRNIFSSKEALPPLPGGLFQRGPKEARFSPGAAPRLVSEAPTLSGAGGCWAAGKLQGRTQQAKPPSADPPSCVFHARPQLGCS